MSRIQARQSHSRQWAGMPSVMRQAVSFLLALVALIAPSDARGQPGTAPSKQAAAGSPELRQDPRLQVKLTCDLVKPRLFELLERLQARTGVAFTADENIRGTRVVFWSLSLHEVPAWSLMTRMREALVVKGAWKRVKEGYHLSGEPTPLLAPRPPAPPPPAPPPRRNSEHSQTSSSQFLPLLLGLGIGGLAVAALYLLPSACRKERTVHPNTSSAPPLQDAIPGGKQGGIHPEEERTDPQQAACEARGQPAD